MVELPMALTPDEARMQLIETVADVVVIDRFLSKPRLVLVALGLLDEHFVILREDDWLIEHSVQCRLSEGGLAACPYNEAVAERFEAGPGAYLGRFRITGFDEFEVLTFERVD